MDNYFKKYFFHTWLWNINCRNNFNYFEADSIGFYHLHSVNILTLDYHNDIGMASVRYTS